MRCRGRKKSRFVSGMKPLIRGSNACGRSFGDWPIWPVRCGSNSGFGIRAVVFVESSTVGMFASFLNFSSIWSKSFEFCFGNPLTQSSAQRLFQALSQRKREEKITTSQKPVKTALKKSALQGWAFAIARTTKKPPSQNPTVETKRKLKRRSKLPRRLRQNLIRPVQRRPIVRIKVLEILHRHFVARMPTIPNRGHRQRPIPKRTMLHVAIQKSHVGTARMPPTNRESILWIRTPRLRIYNQAPSRAAHGKRLLPIIPPAGIPQTNPIRRRSNLPCLVGMMRINIVESRIVLTIPPINPISKVKC